MGPDGTGTGDNTATSEKDVRDASLQRVRVGVTGLAAVFLLTVLAASMFSLLGQDDHGTTRLANGAVVASSTLPPDAPKEPLAELGVAPGNMPPGNGAEPAPPVRKPVPTRPPIASDAHPVVAGRPAGTGF